MGWGLAVCPLRLPAQSVTLSWDPSPSGDAAGYMLHYGYDGINFSNHVDAGANTSMTVSNLSPGTVYFQVNGYNAFGEGLPSAQTGYSVPSPLVVTNLAIGPPSLPAQSATLTWAPNPSSFANPVAGYSILYGTNGTAFPNQVNAGTNTSVVVTNLLSGVMYYFMVEAYDFAGSNSPASAQVVFYIHNPLAVSNLVLNPLTNAAQSVMLSWSPNISSVSYPVAGYRVYYGDDGVHFPNQMDAGANTNLTVNNLPPGIVAYFAATAYNYSGIEGPRSRQVEYFVLNDRDVALVSTNNVLGTTNASTNFTLLIGGNGSLSPSTNAQSYRSGKKNTITAIPDAGWAFVNWVSNGIVVAATPKITFSIGESDLVLQANFIPLASNPFTNAVKTYHGLFFVATNAAAEASSGSFSAGVTKTGSFTAMLRLEPRTYSFSGQFSSAGGTPLQILKRPGGLSPLAVQLGLDLTSNGPMTGTISNADWTADLVADPAIYSKTNQAPQAGQYTLLIGSTNDSSEMVGNGFGTMSVSDLGAVRLNGILGDGTSFSSTSVVSTNAGYSEARWPFYVSLYGGEGGIFGWLSFNSNTLSGQTSWFKQEQPKSKTYPGGFTNNPGVIGSVYSNGLRNLGLSGDQLLLALTNGNLSLTNQITLGKKDVATNSGGDKLTFVSATGLFKGSVVNPPGKPISVEGVVLQNQDIGAGFFLGTTNSGSVLLSPTP